MADGKKKSKIQAAILQKLEEYGDSVLEKPSHGKRKKAKKSTLTAETDIIHNSDITSNLREAESNDNLSARSRRRRKKKKAAIDAKTELESVSDKQDDVVPKTGKERHIETIKQELGLTEFRTLQERHRRCEKQESKDSQSKGRKEPEVVVFTSHKKKHKQQKEIPRSTGSSEDNPEFDMKHARFEVQKFGIKGFQGDQKDAAMTALLVQLGAKPPKNKFQNYKDYQVTRKVEMQQERDKKELDRKLGFTVPNSDRSRKRPKDKNDIGHIDGQVGRFKRGVQYVKKNDIVGIKKSKIK